MVSDFGPDLAKHKRSLQKVLLLSESRNNFEVLSQLEVNLEGSDELVVVGDRVLHLRQLVNLKRLDFVRDRPHCVL